MSEVVELARERFARWPYRDELSHSVVLEAILTVLRDNFPDRDAEIAAFGERLTVRIDLATGTISLRSG